MKFEGVPSRTSLLAEKFKCLLSPEGDKEKTFTELERILTEEGFERTSETELSKVFQSNSLLCRSESFSKVIDLILDHTPITLRDPKGEANMCTMASSEGFKIAMLEGFSGNDVDNTIKTVITFKGEHLTSQNSIDTTNNIWVTKPDTARVSLSGEGDVHFDDVEMVSFRIPTKLFPEKFITEAEQEYLEESGAKFITRHYIPTIKKTVH